MAALAGLAARLGLSSKALRGPLSPLEGWPAFSRHLGVMPVKSIDQQLEEINDLFVEARDEIEYAEEDAETVRFDESFKAAEAAVKEVLDRYAALLEGLPEDERGKIQRGMGLKMEQLKAELCGLELMHSDGH